MTCSSCPDSMKGLVISFFYLTWRWPVTDVWELSQPFTKISLLCFTRSKGLGNETLKELWQREQWMSRKWKGLVACSSSHCTDSGELSEKGLSLFWCFHYQGEEWILHCCTSPRKHSQSPWLGLSMGAEYVTLLFQHVPTAPPCCPGNSFLLPLHSYLQENTVICMY